MVSHKTEEKNFNAFKPEKEAEWWCGIQPYEPEDAKSSPITD
jgi:hypothetical protein